MKKLAIVLIIAVALAVGGCGLKFHEQPWHCDRSGFILEKQPDGSWECVFAGPEHESRPEQPAPAPEPESEPEQEPPCDRPT